MSDAEIKKLKRKLVRMSMLALVLTQLVVAGCLYLGNMGLNRRVIRNTLAHLVEHDGELVAYEGDDPETQENYLQILEYIFETQKDVESPESQYTTRYFAILYDSDLNVSEVKTNHIRAVSEDEAAEYGRRALRQFFKFGRFDNYYYQVKYYEDGSAIVVFLDARNMLASNNRLLYLALILIGFGMLIAFFLVRIFANWAIRNERRNADLQKQFLTNASHELKTPLAVIRANTEMQEILEGESEWTQSTMRQIERLNGLIQNLVMITRVDEQTEPSRAEDVDITRAVHETAINFKSVAMSANKKLNEELAENVHMRGDEAQIRQLCSLLLDNAIKYCDDEGTISISMGAKGKGIWIVVSNTYASGANVDYSKFFERFYRQDESHNVDKGGYGIGLSIAESLVHQYRGDIKADWKDGVINFTCVLKAV